MHNFVSPGGFFTFWDLSYWNDPQPLKDALVQLGLAKLFPKPPTKSSVLRDTLRSVYRDSDFLVRRINPSKNALHAQSWWVGKDKYQEADRFDFHFTASVTAGGIAFHPVDPPNANDIRLLFAKRLRQVRGVQISSTLVNVAVGAFAGTRVAKGGGIYWLSDDYLERWRDLAYAAESCASNNQVALAQVVMTTETALAVTRGIVHEAKAQCAQIQAELDDGALGEKAIRSRSKALEEMLRKVASYEIHFNTSLTEAREAVSDAKAALVQSKLLASVAVPEA
jgi:hypothetical protein